MIGVFSSYLKELNELCDRYKPNSSKKAKKRSNKTENGEQQNKVKAVKKDKDAPKKPTTNVYMIYCNERRKQLLLERPELKSDAKGVARIIGDEWNSLPKDTKDSYYARSKQLKEEQALQENLALQSLNEESKIVSKPQAKQIAKPDKGKPRNTQKESDESDEEESGSDDGESSEEGGQRALQSSSEGESDVERSPGKKVKKH